MQPAAGNLRRLRDASIDVLEWRYVSVAHGPSAKYSVSTITGGDCSGCTAAAQRLCLSVSQLSHAYIHFSFVLSRNISAAVRCPMSNVYIDQRSL